jgi:N-acetylglucosamine kinase-like BadF-type ATPase
MIGLFEAGGTKTEFRYGTAMMMKSIVGKGINPYMQTDDEIQSRILNIKESIQSDQAEIEKIYYYGAGCSKPEQANRVLVVLKSNFPNASIEIESDLLGSCRSLCTVSSGIVAILGTGSNACIFDGSKITDQLFSFGFWLGDEGSGGYLGKFLFKDWLTGKVPGEFEVDFSETFGTTKEAALEILYASKNPNRLISALSSIAIKNKAHPYFRKNIERSISDFLLVLNEKFENQKNLPVHFTGSVAWYLKDEVISIFGKNGYAVGSILQNPIENLYSYHAK